MNQEDFYDANQGNNEMVRQASDIIFLRTFNNFIKSLMIKQCSTHVKKRRDQGLSVLDLCCGKGGDLSKWKIARVSHYVGADLSKNSVAEA
mmetsp:Transcript_24782/g.17487  ORF Transcript_24782/g.17487 Transcript_24782/m.17487 type:complete len:91 (+) Transcript_24782:148-420(+)